MGQENGADRRGEVHQEAARLRPDRLLAGGAFLGEQVARGGVDAGQARAGQHQPDDRLVEVVAAEALDALADDDLVRVPGHFQ